MLTRRYVLVGSVGAGKTSLFNALNNDYGIAVKTQAVAFDDQGGVDTPGEFFNHPRLYSALISTTTEAETIIYVHAANDKTCRLPSGLLDVYSNKEVITVITKIDLPDIDLIAIKEMLMAHGLKEPFFEICTYDPSSVQTLADYLNQDGQSKSLRGKHNE
ncbi:ethanolamine utilization protein EutP [Gammaproteobacteria bacterium ESL0073]|uniref:EutP/PduV family microcompartment system protein n=1 Tax=Entomomonas moraniae TaxID=2213226 RepID=A0A3S9XFB5_9GAMM|nr:EutP/PduV family microcompartment system protein [Entomomonas moraniae]AWM79248.1 ethanolamine utilization protein EutP [Gammaproteobacteria bacterium ESL0073]AZS51111.1 EutP/PduV family microcompartment system protein [Entomomonas moraniae]